MFFQIPLLSEIHITCSVQCSCTFTRPKQLRSLFLFLFEHNFLLESCDSEHLPSDRQVSSSQVTQMCDKFDGCSEIERLPHVKNDGKSIFRSP